MFNRSRSMLVAAVSMMALAGTPALASPQALAPVVTVSKKHKRGLFNGAVQPSSSSLSGGSSLRISVAQGKRNAAKCRNQRRHKRHIRR